MKKTKLPILTIPLIRSWNPCYDPIEYIPESWKGTAIDVLKLKKIPHQDRLWCVLRPEAGIDEKTIRLFACWCAREALKLIPEKEVDPRSVKAIEVSEKFADGKATIEELAAARDDAAAARGAAWGAAARGAAWAAARDDAAAARGAAWAAAWDAARAAARGAAWAAARDAAWDAQCRHLISMLRA